MISLELQQSAAQEIGEPLPCGTYENAGIAFIDDEEGSGIKLRKD
jgi:hypothetical protein